MDHYEKPLQATELTTPTRQTLAINLLLAGGLLVGLAAVMWQQPILADDWEFYRAATNWLQERQLIPHPQAYVHLMQLSFAILGPSIASARLPGVLTALLNLALIPPLIYAFWGRGGESRRIAITAIWLYALNPLTVQNMMMLDIDNTLLVPALLGLLLVWKVARDWPLFPRIAAPGLAFAAALWVKLPTPTLLAGCIGLFHLLRLEIKRVGEWILALLLGGITFVVTFWLYGRLTGYTFAFFGIVAGRVANSSNVLANAPGMLRLLPQGMGIFVMWLSLPLTALFLSVSVGTARRLVRRQLEERDLLVIYVAATALFYALVIAPAWGYPRYHTPLVPVIAILVAALVAPAFRALPQRARFLVAGIGVAAFAYKLVLIGDPLWSLYALTFETSTGDLAQRLTRATGDVVRLVIPIGVALAIVGLLSLRWKIRPLSVVICTLGALAFAHPASTTAVQVPANYSTRYRYTYNYDDLRQTVQDLQERGGYVLAVKDVLYYAGLPGEEIWEYVCPSCSPQVLIDKIHSTQVDALVWTTKEDNRSSNISRDAAVVQTLNACYTRDTHGLFIVYLRKPDGPCP